MNKHLETLETCNECRGAKRATYEECGECDGVGTCFHCGQECPDCKGDGQTAIHHPGGEVYCEDCDGTGKQLKAVLVFGQGCNLHFLAKIVRLGGRIGKLFKVTDNSEAFPFRFWQNGLEVRGIIMPIKPATGVPPTWPVIDLEVKP